MFRRYRAGRGTCLKFIPRALLCTICIAFFITRVDAQQAAVAPAASSARLSDHINPDLPRWLRFSGEYRARFEGLNGSGFRSSANDAYVLNRVRLNTTFIPTSWLKAQIQAQDAQVFWRNTKPDAPPFEDTLDVRQAYLEFGNSETNKLSVRVGRQELAFGEQRLVGHVSWLNTARSFDAVRATYRAKNVRVDAFAASVVNIKDGEFNKRTDGNNFHGAYAVLGAIVPKATVEPYFFWRESGGQRSENGVGGKLDFKTVGARWVGKLPARFDYGVEVAGQTGSLGPDDVRAWGGHWLIGYSLKARYAPRIIAEYNYATGDRALGDGRRGGFDQLYPTPHDKTGLADQVGWKNIHHTRAGLELKPSDKLSTSGGYHSWWLASTTDGLYNVAGALVARDPNGTGGRHIGQEADVQASYAISPQIQLSGGY